MNLNQEELNAVTDLIHEYIQDAILGENDELLETLKDALGKLYNA